MKEERADAMEQRETAAMEGGGGAEVGGDAERLALGFRCWIASRPQLNPDDPFFAAAAAAGAGNIERELLDKQVALELTEDEGCQIQQIEIANAETMSSMSGNVAGSSSDENNKPLWQFVTKLGKAGGGAGGNLSFKCNYCQVTYKGSYSRVKAHLLKINGQGIKVCSKVTSEQLREMRNLMDEAELRMKKVMPRNVLLPPASTSSHSSCSAPFSSMNAGSLTQEKFEPRKRKSKGVSPLEKEFNMQAKEQLDIEIARMFYSAGLPFNLSKNPYYRSCFSLAASGKLSGYVPPGYNAMRTELLQKERANIERLLEPIKSTWREKGVTIVCDGWSDPHRKLLINFIAVTESGPVFLRAINCEGEYKDKFFISNLIKEVIVEVGPTAVVQIITDNAPVCRAAGLLIEQKFPHIFWTPCVVHTLNLVLKNVCAAKNLEANEISYDDCHWVREIVEDALMIKNFILNHSMRFALFNDFSMLKMLAIADTRFASNIVMLRRFKLIKNELQSMVTGEKWPCYREDDLEKAYFVREKLLDDIWWNKVDYILAFTDPIYNMLKDSDTEKPCLHLIYDMWESMIAKVKAAIYSHERKHEYEESSFWNTVRRILEDRWNKSNTPLHCLAHSLNPRYSSLEWLSKNPGRIPPQNDPEIFSISKTCLRRFFSIEERKMVNLELAKFLGCMEEFADEECLRDRWELNPKSWWLVYGSSAPLLQNIALKLLGQPSSSSCCERNWSTYSFVQSMRRDKITPRRAEDLLFVHTNLRLLSRRTPQYMAGQSKMWDVAGDSFDPLDDVGIHEISSLSLDDPEFESVLFTDDCNDREHDANR